MSFRLLCAPTVCLACGGEVVCEISAEGGDAALWSCSQKGCAHYHAKEGTRAEESPDWVTGSEELARARTTDPRMLLEEVTQAIDWRKRALHIVEMLGAPEVNPRIDFAHEYRNQISFLASWHAILQVVVNAGQPWDYRPILAFYRDTLFFF